MSSEGPIHGTFGAEFKFLMSPQDTNSVMRCDNECSLATPSNGFVDRSSVGRAFVFKPIVFCHVLPIVQENNMKCSSKVQGNGGRRKDLIFATRI